MMPNPFDAVVFVLLVAGALNELGWLPWHTSSAITANY